MMMRSRNAERRILAELEALRIMNGIDSTSEMFNLLVQEYEQFPPYGEVRFSDLQGGYHDTLDQETVLFRSRMTSPDTFFKKAWPNNYLFGQGLDKIDAFREVNSEYARIKLCRMDKEFSRQFQTVLSLRAEELGLRSDIYRPLIQTLDSKLDLLKYKHETLHCSLAAVDSSSGVLLPSSRAPKEASSNDDPT